MNNYKKFDFGIMILLHYVTCGIYPLYMWASMTAANNQEASLYGIKQIMGFGIAFLLGLVTCGIFFYYWYYTFMEQQAALAKAKGVKLEPTDSPILLTLLTFVPFYSYYVLCDNYNRTLGL